MRKAIALIFGVLGVVVGASLIAGAITILAQDRDADGFFKTDAYMFEQPGHAIVSEDIEILTETPSWVVDLIGDPVDFRAEATRGSELFLGIGPAADVDRYLSGATIHEVTGIDLDGSVIGGVDYRTDAGITAPRAPADQVFWADTAIGPNELILDWPLEAGAWKLVVMNTDGSAGLSADLALGVKVSNIVPVSWIVLGFGIVSVFGGSYLIYRGSRRTQEAPPRQGGVIDLREEVPEERPFAEKV